MIHKNRCKKCQRTFESVRDDAEFCSDTCSKQWRRRVKQAQEAYKATKNVLDNPEKVRDNLREFIEKEPLNLLEEIEMFIPNWKKNGSKSYKEAVLKLWKVIENHPDRWQFQGYQIDN